jgi:hypothetical protein
MRNHVGVLAAFLLLGCSGDDSTFTSPPADAGPSDGTVSDAPAAQDTAPPPDNYVAPDVGGDDTGTACAAMATKAACDKCCNDTYPAGVKTLLEAEVACACAPAICDGDAGVPDAGADAGDGGVSELGTDACKATCEADAGVDPTCRKCLNESVGSMKNPGPCYTKVQSACTGDCAALVACAAGCPKK